MSGTYLVYANFNSSDARSPRGIASLPSGLGNPEREAVQPNDRVVWVDESLFERSVEIFRGSDRRTWSFTDCSSFALMKQLSISEAFAFDAHFKEAGFTVFP